MTYIYALICPFDGQLKYIGKANNPERRLRDHMQDIRGAVYEKAMWIKKMKLAKKKPILEILDEIEIHNWQFYEEFWIGYFKSIGCNLFNKRSGNGLTFANYQTFRKGHIPWNRKQK